MDLIRLFRPKGRARWRGLVLVGLGAGIVLVPLTLLIERDVGLLPAFSALLVLALALVLWGGEGERNAAGKGVAVMRAVVGSQAGHPGIAGRRLTHGPFVEQVTDLLYELTDLTDDITRLCEELPSTSAPTP